MKVYIEAVFILNFLLDFMILYGTKKLLKRKCKIYRILFSSLLGSFTILFIWISFSTVQLILIKILLSFLMNYIAFGKEKIFENTFYFYLLSIILGGCVELIQIHSSYYLNMLWIVLLCPIVIGIFLFEYKKYKEYHSKLYQVKICFQNQEYLFDGFIDTGNHLKSPISHKPVILVDQYIPHTNPYYIPYKALNYEGLLECMKPDKVYINEVEIKACLVGISKHPLQVNDCHCILPYSIKEEL